MAAFFYYVRTNHWCPKASLIQSVPWLSRTRNAKSYWPLDGTPMCHGPLSSGNTDVSGWRPQCVSHDQSQKTTPGEERAWRPGCGVLEGLLYYMNRGDAVVHEEVRLQ